MRRLITTLEFCPISSSSVKASSIKPIRNTILGKCLSQRSVSPVLQEVPSSYKIFALDPVASSCALGQLEALASRRRQESLFGLMRTHHQQCASQQSVLACFEEFRESLATVFKGIRSKELLFKLPNFLFCFFKSLLG